MNVTTLKLLTWATVVTAVVSALLLAALGPDLTERVGTLGAQTAGVALQPDAMPRRSGVPEHPQPSSH